MRAGSSSWLRVVFLATTLTFAAVAVYVFGLRFYAWLESDAAVPALLAHKSLQAKSPISDSWYYANGDLWLFAQHLFAILPVAILGVGPLALLVANVIGFAVEVLVLVKVYIQYTDQRWIALLATMATLMAWSKAHVAYGYLQLAYGLLTVLYVLSFHVFAMLANDAHPARRRFVVAALLVAANTVNNPTRGVVYLLVPILVACAWPWRSLAVRRRLTLGVVATAGSAAGFAIYTWLAHVVAWSVPRGHVGFVLGGVKQIEANLTTLGHGLVILCAGGGAFATEVRSPVWVIPGALLLIGALALVAREVLARALTPLRWLSVVVLAQLGIILVPLLIGNLLDGPEATRYLITSLLALVGVAVIIATRDVREIVSPWRRRLAAGWLVLLPVAGLVAARDAAPPPPVRGVWPDAAELEKVADELVHRGLTHGFADNLAANLLTLDSRGAALTCRTTMNDILMPQRWLASTTCFDAATLPELFYVVAYRDEFEQTAIRATLPDEADRFSVGNTYEVHVFRTRDVSPAWLDLPIPDRELATFPIRLPATHLQLRRGMAALESSDLVATGEPGIVVWGPYIDLPKGDYTVTWLGTGIDSPGALTFHITGEVNGRRRKLAPPITHEARAIATGRSELVRFAFKAKHPISALDVRIQNTAGARVSLHELVIERSPTR